MKKQNKRLKITIFVTYTFPYIGSGIGNVALTQAEKLASLGHDVALISSNQPKTSHKFTRNKVKHFKLSALYFLEKIHVPVPIFLLNYSVIKRVKNSDIIHVHDSVYPSSFLAILFGKIFSKKIILTQHIAQIEYSNKMVNLIQKIAYATIGKISFAMSDKIIFINENVKNQFKLNDNKTIVLLNGVDTDLFHPVNQIVKKGLRKKYNLPINKKIFLFVGRFVPKKGYKLLLDLNEPNIFMLLIGGNKKYFKNENTLIIYRKSQLELKEYYQLSDIFVLPSHGEGFPLSIQEAMASGLPIITTYNPGYEKLLNDKFTRYIKPLPQAIKNAFTALINNEKEIIEMSKYARKYALEKYSWDNNINSTLEIYRGISK